jgi:hypothetical protein
MTERAAPWVGDVVRDEVADRSAIVTDVRSDGTYLLRAPHGFEQWQAEDPDKLTLVERRQDRQD